MQRVNHYKAISIIAGIAIILILIISTTKQGMLLFWNICGLIRSYFPDISNIVLVFAGLVFAMMPRKAAEAEKKHWHILIGVILAVIGLVGFVLGVIDKNENTRNMTDLFNRSKIQATTQDIKSLRDDISNDINKGFDKVVLAINSLHVSGNIVKTKASPTVITPVEQPRSAPNKISLGPGLVQHIQISQGRTVSNRDDAPYALQVTLQTDIPTQPTAFMFETDGDIEDGRFFLVGQSVMMSVGYGIQPDKRHFYLKFAFPSFTPESPIVVTLLSKTDIHVIAVRKAN